MSAAAGPAPSWSAASQAEALDSRAEASNTPAEAADPELEGLALSSSITELDYALDGVSTLVFEIQEIRHTTASTSQNPAEGGQTPEVDALLLKLEDRLETTNKEVENLQARLNAFFKAQSAGLLRHKWEETLRTWQNLQKESEDLREELVEDKYLTVYRTVSRQADDMMQSLEKIFAQCNAFVHETYKARRTQPNPTTEDLQKQLNTFIGLHKSLHQKTKYYIPSCEKVLKVIDSGISQQRRSLNGEVLRSHADMKLRWRNLQERMTRTEQGMQGVQELLSELSAKSTRADQQAASNSVVSSSASTSSRRSSGSTPSRSSVTTARNKVGDWLSPSPARRPSESRPPESGDSPLQSRSITPFRRLANKLQRSHTNEAPSLPAVHVPAAQSSSSHTSESPETQLKPHSRDREPSECPKPTQRAPPMPRTVSSLATVDRQQRRYSRLPSSRPSDTPDVPPIRHTHLSSAVSERARSPLPPPRSSSSIGTSVSARPAWHVGTRTPQESDLAASVPASSTLKGRKSMPMAGTVRNPSARYSQVTSTYSQNRPQSRIFTTPSSSSFRPPSPAFSNTSNTSATSPRPSSLGSRIPAPGSSADTPQRNGRRPHHGSPDRAEDMETLHFAPSDAEGSTSIMQRAFSPTPSQSGFSVTSSRAGTPGGTRRQSRIPRLSLGDAQLPDPRMLSIPPPPRIPDMYSDRSEIMTPEPALRSNAERVSAIYSRLKPSTGGRKSFGPGSMHASDYANSPQMNRSLTASTSGTRPSSRLSVGAGGQGRRASFYAPLTSSRLVSPPPDMPDDGTEYYPNKHDPLDVEIAETLKMLPLHVKCKRKDLPLTKAAAEAQAPSDRMAMYWLGQADKPILCKLVDRGDRKPRKVLCKIAGEWQDMYMYLLNQQAQY